VVRAERPISLPALFDRFLQPPIAELEARHITEYGALRYEIRWHEARGRWVLPIKGLDSELWGWQFKGVDGVWNYPKGVPKKQTLFGADWLSASSKWVIMVESPLDVVWLFDLGYTSVATFGAQVSDIQISLLTEYADRILLALDNDEPGLKAMDKIVSRWATRADLSIINYDADSPKDVGEMTAAQVQAVLSSPISAWEWMEMREGAQAQVQDRKGLVPLSARSRRSDDRAKKTARGYGDGARKDDLHHRRRRASHRTG
jgi:hypothetical protein